MRCEEVRQHTISCPSCRAESNDFELWDALGDVPTEQVPSDRMRARFSTLLAAETASRPSPGTDAGPAPGPPDRPRRGTDWRLLAVAASVLIAGVIAGRVTAPRPQPAASEIAGLRGDLRDMRQMLTLSLLQQPSATERLRGVSWTAQIDEPGNEVVSALLDTLLHDPSVNVRLAAVDALRRFSGREDVRQGTERAAADISSPLLQVAVIDFLVETRNQHAPELLKRLTDDTAVDEAVRSRAAWGLRRLNF